MKSRIKKIEFRQIGYYETPYSLATGAPRQGRLMTETKGKIVLNKKYMERLKDLSEFEYIWVIFLFDEVESWENIVRPPESDHSFQVFATRSPRRPNPIGLSLTRLESVQDNILHISGIDAFNNTPIIDIKPFLPSVDYVKNIKNESAEAFLGHHDKIFIDEIMVKEFVEGKKTEPEE